MFFSITHILIDKYYPKLFMQLLIGFACYMVALIMICDVNKKKLNPRYKYYALLLVVMDTTLMIYISKSNSKSKQTVKVSNLTESDNGTNTQTIDETEFDSNNLSSEINNFKITHDLSQTTEDMSHSIFSTSEEFFADDKNKSLKNDTHLSTSHNVSDDSKKTSDVLSDIIKLSSESKKSLTPIQIKN